jgi:autotransporter-associated beta strand protein
MNGDLKVTTADGAWMGANYAIHDNLAKPAQLRADYNQDGSVNVNDMSSLWNDGRNHDASKISSPTAADVVPSEPGDSAGTVIDGTTVILASVDTLGTAGSSLTVQNGGVLDLGKTSQSVGVVTLASGSIGNGTLNATAYFVSQGAISADLIGQGAAMIKTGPGTVVLSGTNGYTGGTSVLDGEVIVTNAAALPDGGNLSVGNFDQQNAAVVAVSNSAAAPTVAAAASIATATDSQALAATVNTSGITPLPNGSLLSESAAARAKRMAAAMILFKDQTYHSDKVSESAVQLMKFEQ